MVERRPAHQEDLKKLIREVPDFPKPGILFYDITTLLKDKAGFRGVIDGLEHHYQDAEVDVVLGIEARGFIFAPALAYALGAGFVPVRKPKKLPAECVSVTYDLEYGTDTPGDAQGRDRQRQPRPDRRRPAGHRRHRRGGGTHGAAKPAAPWSGLGFVVELTFLNGRQKLAGHDVFSLLQYDK